MAAVAEYCHRELTDVGVKAVVPKGGFYIFPNFEVLRETLTAQGIHTCEQMVEKLFRETAVSYIRLRDTCLTGAVTRINQKYHFFHGPEGRRRAGPPQRTGKYSVSD
ncbi:hypothetical protein DPMN_128060 [Dreissena polymorpha]|uniref:Uncharacterized protein n=1 Tax=Dreissena polymorpha TaxID=45954 RepID=A0A9D4GYU2_DREPO|nr:hypothetical protein DPMN_128060 [Dreissena polymorpha]